MDSQIDTGFGPEVKYAPAGLAMQWYATACAARTPRNDSVAIMNGRRYRLVSGAEGTQSTSVRTSSRMESTKVSTGSSGSASRRADRWKRLALASGRNVQTEPSACR
ncbi:hypothetical protein QE359_003115 [Curtobacterium sp. SORGH_AS776]|nr:hypothetical protein [Curtobacterium sp. SORGH_AS_0776]